MRLPSGRGRLGRRGAERVQPRNVPAQNQRVHVVGPLIRVHGLEIRGVTQQQVLALLARMRKS